MTTTLSEGLPEVVIERSPFGRHSMTACSERPRPRDRCARISTGFGAIWPNGDPSLTTSVHAVP